MKFIRSFVLPSLVVVIALAVAFFGTFDADTNYKRAAVHAIIAAVFTSEMASMAVRTRRYQWDTLAIWMLLVRIAIVNYFSSMAMEFSGITDYPEWWFSFSRLSLGSSGIIAFLLLAKEDVKAYKELSPWARLKMASVALMVIGFYSIMALIW